MPKTLPPLDPAVAQAFGALHWLFHERMRQVRELAGGVVPPTLLRVELLRLALMRHGEGVVWRISDYQRAAAGIGSPSKVRQDLVLLVDRKLLAMDGDPSDGRARRVYPTWRLIDFHNKEFPLLVAELQRRLCENWASQ